MFSPYEISADLTHVPSGRTYFVNKRTGQATSDGRSWERAVDQISTAITLSEAYRVAGEGVEGSTNDYVRNIIVVQGIGEHGTGMYYDPLTALPLHCTIIGLGDWAAGLGEGIAAIGEFDGDCNGITASSTVRGLNLFNLQINGDGAGYSAMDVANFFRCRIEDCWLGQMTGSDNINAGIICDNSFSGNLIRHCMIGQTNADGRPDYGLDFENCAPGSNNLIEDNVIFGEVTGILQTSGDNWNGTVIRNNTIGAITGQCSTSGITASLYELIANNYITAADPIIAPSANQTIGNIIVDDGVGTTETLYADKT